MNILFVDDEKTFNDETTNFLKECDYNVKNFLDPSEAMSQCHFSEIDLAILDIKISNYCSGYDLYRYLKEYNPNLPIIFVSGLKIEQHMPKVFDMGANDYLRKPFDLFELKYRIDKILVSKQIVNLENNYFYNITTKELFYNKKLVDLTKSEKNIVHLLIINKNHFLDVYNIINYLEKETTSHAITSHIKNIRKKTYKEFITNNYESGYSIKVKI